MWKKIATATWQYVAVLFGSIALAALCSVSIPTSAIVVAVLGGFAVWALFTKPHSVPRPAAIGAAVSTLIAIANLYLGIVGRPSDIPFAWLVPAVVLGGLTLSLASALNRQPS